jgi:hypothetical protein
MIDLRDFASICDRLRSAPFVRLVILRPVPALAESSCIVAGTVRVRAAGFMTWTLLTNLAILVIHYAAGSKAIGSTPALAGGVTVPALAILATRAFNYERLEFSATEVKSGSPCRNSIQGVQELALQRDSQRSETKGTQDICVPSTEPEIRAPLVFKIDIFR